MGLLVNKYDARRAPVESFIKARYAAEHSARIETFPARLLCQFDPHGKIICAAGVRASSDGFFSEAYLDLPIEQMLSTASNNSILRSEIFEVSCFVSRAPHRTARFISDIVDFGFEHGYTWAFFTVTRRLTLLLNRVGLTPVFLAHADPNRIADAIRWGDYYLREPQVLAVSGDAIRALRGQPAAA